jgi:hypothetical protein
MAYSQAEIDRVVAAMVAYTGPDTLRHTVCSDPDLCYAAAVQFNAAVDAGTYALTKITLASIQTTGNARLSAGDCAPLFTTTESNVNGTPDLNFQLSNAAARSWFGNAGSAPGAPAYNTTPLPVSMGGSGANALAGHGALVVNAAGDALTVVAPGTAGNSKISNGTDWISKGPFVSADQTIAAAASFTLAHGLPYTPLQLWYALVCQTGNAGYSPGDVVVQYPYSAGVNGQLSSVAMWADATNVSAIVCSGGVFEIPNKTTGAGVIITNASWKLRFYAR